MSDGDFDQNFDDFDEDEQIEPLNEMPEREYSTH